MRLSATGSFMISIASGFTAIMMFYGVTEATHDLPWVGRVVVLALSLVTLSVSVYTAIDGVVIVARIIRYEAADEVYDDDDDEDEDGEAETATT